MKRITLHVFCICTFAALSTLALLGIGNQAKGSWNGLRNNIFITSGTNNQHVSGGQNDTFESTVDLNLESEIINDTLLGSKQWQLLSERTALLNSSKDDALYFYDSKPVVTRFAEVEISDGVKNVFSLQHGESLVLNLFENTEYISTVIDAYENVNGTNVVTTKLDDFDFAYAIITTTGQRSLANIVIPELLKYYQIISDPISQVHYIVEMNSYDRDMLQNGPALIPSMITLDDIEEQISIEEELIILSSGPNDPANIDVMIVYTPAAQTWANSNGGGIQNVIAQSMAKALLVLNNSQTFMTMTLVHSAVVTYTESGNSVTDLQRFTSTNDGHMDVIHTWRNTYAADLCALFTLVNDTGGVGWLLTSTSGMPTHGFSIARVQQAGTTYTLIHEMGHNMGLHHHKQQNFQAGPGLYSYSAAWRWQAGSSWYNSVMAYSAGQYYNPPAPGAGINSTEVPYFSNPSVTHLGVATGHSSNGDNARTLREIKHVIAAYRGCISPSQPSAITGPANPCKGSTGNTYSVTNVSGITYNWTYSGSGHTITSGQNTNSIVVSYSSNATSGTWTVSPSNSCGTGTTRTLAVTLNTLPSQPSAIAGTAIPCQGSMGNTYSVANVSGVTYNWTYSGSGHTITSGQNTNSIAVNYSSNATSGTWTVSPSNTCGTGTTRTLAVTLNTLPSQPSAITGTANPCQGSTGNTYSVTNVSGVTFTWTHSGTGHTIASGQNTNSIAVNYSSNATSGTWTVSPSNTCGTGTTRTLAVTLNTLPSQPSAITGTANPCQGSTGNTYSVTNVSGVTFTWTYSGTGHTITSGQNTNSIAVNYSSNATSGTWTVSPSNTCGTGTTRTLAVTLNTLPSQPGAISGPVSAFQGSSEHIYSVTNVSGVNYSWSYSGSGAMIIEGQGTNSINISYSANATSGSLTVIPGNICSNGASESITVSIIEVPMIVEVQDTIILSDQSICYSATQHITVAGNGMQFIVSNNGHAEFIAGESIKFLPTTTVHSGGHLHAYISQTGDYCSLAKSLVNATITDDKDSFSDQEPARNILFHLFPNPTHSTFTLELFDVETDFPVVVEIYSLQGERLLRNELSGDNHHEFDLSAKPRGVYVIRVTSGDKVGVGKLILN